MKKAHILSVAAVVCTVCVLFSGCSLFQKSVPVNASSQQKSSSSQVSSAGSEEETSKPADSSSENSFPSVSQPAESQPGPVLPIETDDKDFNKKFQQNPIDKKYIEESNQAVSNVDMVKVSEKYSGIWQDEIAHAYSELKKQMSADSSEKPAKYKAEQEQWENGKADALKKISDEALSGGGSMAQVNEASEIMDFYRSRTAQLYRELYDYNKNFSYNFSVK